jgi:hypothetical protein
MKTLIGTLGIATLLMLEITAPAKEKRYDP